MSARKTLERVRVVYGPPDWLVGKFNARDRRAFGFWTLIGSIIGAIFWRSELWFLTVISIFALVPNFSSETPVESEDS